MLVQIADTTPWSREECWDEDTSGLEGALFRAGSPVVLTFRLHLATVPELTSSHQDEGKKDCCVKYIVTKALSSHIELGGNDHAYSVEKAGTARTHLGT